MRHHADTQTVMCFKQWKGYAIYICDVKFEMLQVRENEISQRKWSGGGTAQLRALEGTLPAIHLCILWRHYRSLAADFKLLFHRHADTELHQGSLFSGVVSWTGALHREVVVAKDRWTAAEKRRESRAQVMDVALFLCANG